MRAAWDDLSLQPDAEPVFDSGAVWQLSRTESRYAYRFVSPTFGAVPYRTAALSAAFSA